MDKEIICNIDMFSLNQTAHLDNQSFSFPTDDLYKSLTAVCYDQKVYKVHFFGNEDYIDGIMSDMFADEVTRYGQNIIEIEVN